VNDLAGFPERLVDGEGRVLGEITRTVWGAAALLEGSTAGTPLRFLGQYEDEETGLFYNRYRYYDPAVGRYISPDPLELVGGLNVFVYGQNSPFFFGDPFGLIYTRIVDTSTKPPTVLHEGFSVNEAKGKSPEDGGQIPQTFTDKPCAETQALQRMKNQITDEIRKEQAAAKKKGTKKNPFKPMSQAEIEAEATARMKRKFDNPNISIETFQKKGGPRVDPCSSCGKMFETLKITGAVVGAKGKRGQHGKYSKPKGY
jgi:RHS repeat-associated protein